MSTTAGRGFLTTAIVLVLIAAALWLAARSPSLPYNVRELLAPAHPGRSAMLLSIALFLTLSAPAWLMTWRRPRTPAIFLLPVALLLIGLVTWFALLAAVPRESIHDLVGSPVLQWPAGLETCARFLALHGAVTMLVLAAAACAGVLFDRTKAGLLFMSLAVTLVFAPLLHWFFVTAAATENLTELMRGGGTPGASAFLAFAVGCIFFSGSTIAAAIAFRRLTWLAALLVVVCSAGAYACVAAGTEPFILKYGKLFSALQFLLSAERSHYVAGTELIVRYAVAQASLVAMLALLQYPAWVVLARMMSPRAGLRPADIGQPSHHFGASRTA